MTRFLTFIAVILVAITANAQQLSQSLSKKDVLIGDPTTLSYKVVTNKNDSIRFVPASKEIPVRLSGNGQVNNGDNVVEIRTPFKPSYSIKNGKKHWEGTYEIVVWDSGSFVIPGPNITVGDSTMYFKDLKISGDFTKRIKGVDIYDIREGTAELPPEENAALRLIKKLWWILLILILPVIIILYVRYVSKRNQPVKIVKAMSLKDRTLKAIEALENEKLWEKGQLKQHYIELSYILRLYLTTRYDLSLLEKTTYETKSLLLQKGLNEDTVDTIVVVLSQSDMVKFAKSQPEAIEILKISTLARQIVAETSPLEFDNYE